MANETQNIYFVDRVDIERLKELVKAKVNWLTDVVYITTWANTIYLCLLGYKGEPEGLVEFTTYGGKFVFHNYTPVGSTVSVSLINRLDSVAELMNAPVVERED